MRPEINVLRRLNGYARMIRHRATRGPSSVLKARLCASKLNLGRLSPANRSHFDPDAATDRRTQITQRTQEGSCGMATDSRAAPVEALAQDPVNSQMAKGTAR